MRGSGDFIWGGGGLLEPPLSKVEFSLFLGLFFCLGGHRRLYVVFGVGEGVGGVLVGGVREC